MNTNLIVHEEAYFLTSLISLIQNPSWQRYSILSIKNGKNWNVWTKIRLQAVNEEVNFCSNSSLFTFNHINNQPSHSYNSSYTEVSDLRYPKEGIARHNQSSDAEKKLFLMCIRPFSPNNSIIKHSNKLNKHLTFARQNPRKKCPLHESLRVEADIHWYEIIITLVIISR